MSESAPEVSIVIPAYNEESRLPGTLQRVREWLCAAAPSAEVLVVDDGSTDRTSVVVRELQQSWPGLRLLQNPGNCGKGYSVRRGALEACGRVVLLSDADLSAPIEEAKKLLAALADHEIAIGSRALDRSLIEVHQSRLRELAGILFNFMVRAVLWLPYADTQCGFKAFLRDPCRVVFSQQRIERFGFDPEVLYIARRHGLRIAEIPVRWAHDPGTRVAMMRDSMMMFYELWVIRWNGWLGRYPRSRRWQGA